MTKRMNREERAKLRTNGMQRRGGESMGCYDDFGMFDRLKARAEKNGVSVLTQVGMENGLKGRVKTRKTFKERALIELKTLGTDRLAEEVYKLLQETAYDDYALICDESTNSEEYIQENIEKKIENMRKATL